MSGLNRTLISPGGRTGWQFLALLFCLLSASSCSILSFGGFHEARTTNVILEFYGWESIYMIRPDTRQAGFLPLLSRAQVEQELDHRVLPRNLAVVVISNTYSKAQVAQLATEWKELLHAQSFRPVVLLHANEGNRINGLRIIEDSAISSPHAQQDRAATYAALPPTPRTDAAHPSGDSVR